MKTPSELHIWSVVKLPLGNKWRIIGEDINHDLWKVLSWNGNVYALWKEFAIHIKSPHIYPTYLASVQIDAFYALLDQHTERKDQEGKSFFRNLFM